MTPKNLPPFAILLLTACGADLPENWDNAAPIDDFQQSDCAGDPDDELEENEEDSANNLSMNIENGLLNIDFNKAVFRCEQEVEGFQKAEANHISVLLQPKEMNPSMVAKCSCLYNFSLSFPVENSGGYTVDLYTRSDRYGGEAELQSIHTIEMDSE